MEKFDKLIYHMILLFIIGGFFGFIFETLGEFFKTGKFVSRQGLWFSLFKPIYGTCLILLTILLYKLKDKNIFIIFIAGIIIGSVFEYVSSIFQEYVFHTKSWDYSKMSANLDERINLLYSIVWGILSLFWIKLGLPIYQKLFNFVYGNLYTKVFCIVILAFLVYDIAFTCIITKRYSERKRGIPATTNLDKYLDKQYKNSVFEKKFPNMKVKT